MLIALGVSAACGAPASTGPNLTFEPGFVHVEYEGSIEGEFSVAGPLALDAGQPPRQEFAAAGANARFPTTKLTVVGYQPIGTREGTYFAITIPDIPAGASVAIDARCVELECSSMLLLFGVGPRNPHEDLDPSRDRTCWIEQGQLLITERSSSNVGGRFSGTGGCVKNPSVDPVTPFAVKSASFSVPVSVVFRPRIDLF